MTPIRPLSPSQRRLVEDHLYLPRVLAARALRRNTKLRRHRDDLEQEGAMGLMIAAQRFDVTRGVKFSTYAWYWVRVYVDRAARGVRTPDFEFADRDASTPPSAESVVLAHEVVRELVARRAQPVAGGRHGQPVYVAANPERDVALYLRVRALGETHREAAEASGVTRQRAEQICKRVDELVADLAREAA